ncbi:MAG: 2-oxoacid:acceptor oxidoreductase family protein [Candidatus Omnitrophica bacterium]|nr:2-oxoacid:acceptor oxidoreductase family protein [Candidatus Omnitrophota bacterium]
MKDFSILIAGKAGFGIDKAGMILAAILNQLGFRIYIYRDYPSLIRGGHTFSIIRASEKRISVHSDKVNFILALNQEAVDLHKKRLKKNAKIIFDSTVVKSKGTGIAISGIIQEEKASEIMRNTCIIGSFCKVAGIDWNILDEVFRKNIDKELDMNLKIARRGFDAAQTEINIRPIAQEAMPLVTGNEAIGLGLVNAGLKAYIAYPMTPSSGILHFMASNAQSFGLKVVHPESEISVMLMSLGFAYAGQKCAVGTSGGGFCLMAEGLSFSGQANLPAVIVLGQRPGPSTGLPTYTAQTELNFAMSAGQGEFSRFITAPADPEDAYYWSGIAMNLSWKYFIPSIILTDKTLAEGVFNFDINSIVKINEENPASWQNGLIKKAISYEHDQAGITTQEMRMNKEKFLVKELEKYECVKTFGNKKSKDALLCWGSNKGVCVEVAEKLNLRAIQVSVIWPLPKAQLVKSLSGTRQVICVENNSTAQFSRLCSSNGIKITQNILKYDGRPFSVEELEKAAKGILK